MGKYNVDTVTLDDGVKYAQVKDRITLFREHQDFKGLGIKTELVTHSADFTKVIIRALVINMEGQVIASGMAHKDKNLEKDLPEDEKLFLKFSHVEVCETGAVGRALANLGIGIEGSIASYEEVAEARVAAEKTKKAQKSKEPQKEEPIKKGAKYGEMTMDQYEEVIRYIEETTQVKAKTVEKMINKFERVPLQFKKEINKAVQNKKADSVIQNAGGKK